MIYAILQMLSLSTGHIIVKYSFETFHPWHIIVLMNVCALAILALFFLFRPSSLSKLKNIKENRKALLLIILLCCIHSAAFYMSLYLLGLSGHAVLGRLLPIMMMSSGIFFFQEHLSKPKIGLIAVVVISGFMFVIGESAVPTNAIGALMSLISSAGWVGMNIVIKKHAQTIDNIALVMVRVPSFILFFGISFIVAEQLGWILPIPGQFVLENLPVFFAAGLCMVIIPYILFPLALKHTDLSMISVINAVQPIIGFSVGILLFAEPADSLKLAAAGTAIGACLLYSGYTYLKSFPPKLPNRS